VAETDPTVPQDVKEKAAKFWQAWKDDKQKMLQTVVDLEKAAMNKGFFLSRLFRFGALPTVREMQHGNANLRSSEFGTVL
jgi:predicted metal-binding protein